MNIDKLCPFSLGKDNARNHCAHYVSHIMGYELPGPSCKNFTWADKQKIPIGATIRVDDLFKASPQTDFLKNKPAAITECLIFVTLASNMVKVGSKYEMKNQPKKHIGILSQGKVWNYSNTHNKVVADLLSVFQTKFSSAYRTWVQQLNFITGICYEICNDFIDFTCRLFNYGFKCANTAKWGRSF